MSSSVKESSDYFDIPSALPDEPSEPEEDLWATMREHPMGKVLIEAFVLALRKNKDYGLPEEIFANFMGSGRMGVKPSIGCAVRGGDKWTRFEKGVDTDWDMSVKEEGMVDTVLDIINYMCIYRCLRELEESSGDTQ